MLNCTRRNVLAAMAGAAVAPRRVFAANDPWALHAAILKRIGAPKFPSKDFPVTRYGAKSGGKIDCTEAVRSAIEAASRAGGGVVFGRDPSEDRRQARRREGCHDPVPDRAETLSDRADPLRGHGVHELLAAGLRVRSDQYRDYRRRHARWAGEREKLVGVERLARPRQGTESNGGTSQAGRD